MSIATLREELLRELALAALGDVPGDAMLLSVRKRRAIRAEADPVANPLEWTAGATNMLQRASILRDKGPALVEAHVTDGMLLWFAPGVLSYVGGSSPVRTVRTTTEPCGTISLWLDGHRWSEDAVDVFLENVLDGNVRDPAEAEQ